MSENEQQPPKIQVDSDWKEEARLEKERLASQASQEGDEPSAGSGQLPPADFQTLVSTMVTQALMAMGAVPDPATGKRVAYLDLARFHIDMLDVLEQKTKGNLSDEETQLVTGALNELRMQYVQLSKQAEAQLKAQADGGPADAAGDLRTPGA